MSAPTDGAAAPAFPAAALVVAAPSAAQAVHGVDPVHIVTGEAHLVLAAMRLNKRWAADVLAPDVAAGAAAPAPETLLLSAFFSLLETVHQTSVEAGGLARVDPMVYLKPFLDVIQSDVTSGPITGVALAAVHKMLHHVLSPASPNISTAMREVARALANCRFEATDPEADQSTLAKLLQVLVASVQASTGRFMPDDAVCDLYDTVFRLAVPQRSRSVSALLRSVAEQSIIEFTRAVFVRLNLPPQAAPTEGFGPSALLRILKAATGALSAQQTAQLPAASPPVLQPPSGASASASPAPAQSPAPQPQASPLPPRQTPTDPAPSSLTPGVATAPAGGAVTLATGLPPPANPKTKAEAQYVALNVVNTVSEVCGSALSASREFTELITGDLCFALLQLLHTPHTSILAITLRVLLNLFASCRPVLKLHLEAFIVTLAKLAGGAGTEAVHQPRNIELLLQTLGEMCRDTEFAVELYANYDCDLYCSNVFKVLSEALYKAAFPRGGALTDAHVLALDALLSLLSSLWRSILLADGTPANAATSVVSQAESQRLRRSKQKKTTIAACVEKFNQSPKEGIKMLQQQGILSDPLDPKAMAVFLKSAPGLDKAAVGEWISSRHEINNQTLKEYIKLFSLSERPFMIGFREFMQSFISPGDANLISRILEAYGQEYVTVAKDGIFENADACYVTAYSVILLNVDQHNSALKEKMSLEQYTHNSRGINNHKNFSNDFLAEIYYDIKASPLRVPEEVPSGTMTQKSCDDLKRRAPRVARYLPISQFAGKGALDLYRDVFATLWNPLIAALSVCFESATEERTLTRVLHGFSLCGKVASKYQLTEVIDYLVVYLCKASSLPFSVPVENPVMSFGSNLKAHIAATSMFSLVREHANFLRESWVNVLAIISALHDMELVSDVPDFPDFTLETVCKEESCTHHTHSHTHQKSRKHHHDHDEHEEGSSSKGGSWLGSLIWGSSEATDDAEDQKTPEELEALEAAQRCADGCHVYDMIEQSKIMDDAALRFLMKALVHCSSAPTSTQDEEGVLFFLDILIKVTLLNTHRIGNVWTTSFAHLSSALAASAEAGQGSPFSERATVGLLIFCINLSHKPELLKELTAALWTIARLPPTVIADLADVISLGAATLAKATACKSLADAGSLSAILSLIESVGSYADGYSKGFEALSFIIKSEIAMTPEEHKICTHTLGTFLKSRARVDVSALHGLEMMHVIFKRAPSIAAKYVVTRSPPTSVQTDAALLSWEMCSHIMSSLCEMSRDPVAEVRNSAISVLQGVLLSTALEEISQKPIPPSGETPGQAAGWAISRSVRVVVFPLLSSLLHPFGNGKDADETRLRACTLLSKTFLQHLPALSQSTDFMTLWADILGFYEQYMILATAPKKGAEILAEALPESLKNMMLVMTAIGLFDIATPKGRELWELTCRALDRICPGMRQEVLPPPQSASPQQQQQQAPVQAQAQAPEAPQPEAPQPEQNITANQPHAALPLPAATAPARVVVQAELDAPALSSSKVITI